MDLVLVRGEAFRRQRNLQGGHVRAPSLVQGPSLPPLFINEAEDSTVDAERVSSPPETRTAGPPPPRSWIPSSHSSSHTASWRSHALSLILRRTPSSSAILYPRTASRVPSLSQLCMQILVTEYGGIPPEFFHYLPRHILREYVRYCAVYAPNLPKEDLEALWTIDRAASADGELLITGPFAESMLSRTSEFSDIVPNDWESMSDSIGSDPPPALHTFIVLASPFPASLTSLLPPTLTHIALLNIPQIPLHSLPAQLPLVTVLDLSFNPWLGSHAGKPIRLEWRKWKKLQSLGLRGCAISDGDACYLKKSVNRDRMINVEIVFIE